MTSQPSQEGDIAVDSTFIGEGITSTDYDSTITLDGWGDGCGQCCEGSRFALVIVSAL